MKTFHDTYLHDFNNPHSNCSLPENFILELEMKTTIIGPKDCYQLVQLVQLSAAKGILVIFCK